MPNPALQRVAGELPGYPGGRSLMGCPSLSAGPAPPFCRCGANGFMVIVGVLIGDTLAGDGRETPERGSAACG